MNKMEMKEIIMKRLESQPKVIPSELAKEFNYSENTIIDCCLELGLTQIDEEGELDG